MSFHGARGGSLYTTQRAPPNPYTRATSRAASPVNFSAKDLPYIHQYHHQDEEVHHSSKAVSAHLQGGPNGMPSAALLQARHIHFYRERKQQQTSPPPPSTSEGLQKKRAGHIVVSPATAQRIHDPVSISHVSYVRRASGDGLEDHQPQQMSLVGRADEERRQRADHITREGRDVFRLSSPGLHPDERRLRRAGITSPPRRDENKEGRAVVTASSVVSDRAHSGVHPPSSGGRRGSSSESPLLKGGDVFSRAFDSLRNPASTRTHQPSVDRTAPTWIERPESTNRRPSNNTKVAAHVNASERNPPPRQRHEVDDASRAPAASPPLKHHFIGPVSGMVAVPEAIASAGLQSSRSSHATTTANPSVRSQTSGGGANNNIISKPPLSTSARTSMAWSDMAGGESKDKVTWDGGEHVGRSSQLGDMVNQYRRADAFNQPRGGSPNADAERQSRTLADIAAHAETALRGNSSQLPQRSQSSQMTYPPPQDAYFLPPAPPLPRQSNHDRVSTPRLLAVAAEISASLHAEGSQSVSLKGEEPVSSNNATPDTPHQGTVGEGTPGRQLVDSISVVQILGGGGRRRSAASAATSEGQGLAMTGKGRGGAVQPSMTIEERIGSWEDSLAAALSGGGGAPSWRAEKEEEPNSFRDSCQQDTTRDESSPSSTNSYPPPAIRRYTTTGSHDSTVFKVGSEGAPSSVEHVGPTTTFLKRVPATTDSAAAAIYSDIPMGAPALRTPTKWGADQRFEAHTTGSSIVLSQPQTSASLDAMQSHPFPGKAAESSLEDGFLSPELQRRGPSAATSVEVSPPTPSQPRAQSTAPLPVAAFADSVRPLRALSVDESPDRVQHGQQHPSTRARWLSDEPHDSVSGSQRGYEGGSSTAADSPLADGERSNLTRDTLGDRRSTQHEELIGQRQPLPEQGPVSSGQQLPQPDSSSSSDSATSAPHGEPFSDPNPTTIITTHSVSPVDYASPPHVEGHHEEPINHKPIDEDRRLVDVDEELDNDPSSSFESIEDAARNEQDSLRRSGEGVAATVRLQPMVPNVNLDTRGKGDVVAAPPSTSKEGSHDAASYLGATTHIASPLPAALSHVPVPQPHSVQPWRPPSPHGLDNGRELTHNYTSIQTDDMIVTTHTSVPQTNAHSSSVSSSFMTTEEPKPSLLSGQVLPSPVIPQHPQTTESTAPTTTTQEASTIDIRRTDIPPMTLDHRNASRRLSLDEDGSNATTSDADVQDSSFNEADFLDVVEEDDGVGGCTGTTADAPTLNASKSRSNSPASALPTPCGPPPATSEFDQFVKVASGVEANLIAENMHDIIDELIVAKEARGRSILTKARLYVWDLLELQELREPLRRLLIEDACRKARIAILDLDQREMQHRIDRMRETRELSQPLSATTKNFSENVASTTTSGSQQEESKSEEVSQRNRTPQDRHGRSEAQAASERVAVATRMAERGPSPTNQHSLSSSTSMVERNTLNPNIRSSPSDMTSDLCAAEERQRHAWESHLCNLGLGCLHVSIVERLQDAQRSQIINGCCNGVECEQTGGSSIDDVPPMVRIMISEHSRGGTNRDRDSATSVTSMLGNIGALAAVGGSLKRLRQQEAANVAAELRRRARQQRREAKDRVREQRLREMVATSSTERGSKASASFLLSPTQLDRDLQRWEELAVELDETTDSDNDNNAGVTVSGRPPPTTALQHLLARAANRAPFNTTSPIIVGKKPPDDDGNISAKNGLTVIAQLPFLFTLPDGWTLAPNSMGVQTLSVVINHKPATEDDLVGFLPSHVSQVSPVEDDARPRVTLAVFSYWHYTEYIVPAMIAALRQAALLTTEGNRGPLKPTIGGAARNGNISGEADHLGNVEDDTSSVVTRSRSQQIYHHRNRALSASMPRGQSGSMARSASTVSTCDTALSSVPDVAPQELPPGMYVTGVSRASSAVSSTTFHVVREASSRASSVDNRQHHSDDNLSPAPRRQASGAASASLALPVHSSSEHNPHGLSRRGVSWGSASQQQPPQGRGDLFSINYSPSSAHRTEEQIAAHPHFAILEGSLEEAASSTLTHTQPPAARLLDSSIRHHNEQPRILEEENNNSYYRSWSSLSPAADRHTNRDAPTAASSSSLGNSIILGRSASSFANPRTAKADAAREATLSAYLQRGTSSNSLEASLLQHRPQDITSKSPPLAATSSKVTATLARNAVVKMLFGKSDTARNGRIRLSMAVATFRELPEIIQEVSAANAKKLATVGGSQFDGQMLLKVTALQELLRVTAAAPSSSALPLGGSRTTTSSASSSGVALSVSAIREAYHEARLFEKQQCRTVNDDGMIGEKGFAHMILKGLLNVPLT